MNLDEEGRSAVFKYDIAHHEILEADHPLFIQPTTGVVIGDQFYYIANSQLQVFRRLYEEGGEAAWQRQLQDVVVLTINIE